MTISRLDEARFDTAYGILCAPAPLKGDRDGLYSTFCKIPSGSKTILHAHIEAELFYIISGTGVLTLNGEAKEITSKALIRIPPFTQHELINMGHDELIFLSVYSDEVVIPSLSSSLLITSAPPTPNGPLHLGHISGPYLAADILARYCKMRSSTVTLHSGTDDHQNYVHEKAHALQMPIIQFKDRMRSQILQDFTRMQISMDEFIEPKNDIHYQQRILNFVERAIASKVITLTTLDLPFCIQCDCMLIDALINGTCPFCKAESHGACEHCGMVVPPYALQDPTCARCHTAAAQVSRSLYTFNISQYFPPIYDELKHYALPKRVRALIDNVLQHNAMQALLTYQSHFNEGITIPATDQMLHVWFEMAAHYEQFALNPRYWVHSFGFDNSFYYLIFIPSLLRAMHQQAKLPNAVIINDFLQLHGAKFSTSREHVLWVNQFNGNIDHLRLFLCLCRPAASTTDFSLEEFNHFSSQLNMQLQTINEHAAILGRKSCGAINIKTISDCNVTTRHLEYSLSPSQYDLRRASRQLVSFIDLVLEAQHNEHDEKLMIQALATFMAPFMPTESERLLKSLGKNSAAWIKDWSHHYAAI